MLLDYRPLYVARWGSHPSKMPQPKTAMLSEAQHLIDRQ